MDRRPPVRRIATGLLPAFLLALGAGCGSDSPAGPPANDDPVDPPSYPPPPLVPVPDVPLAFVDNTGQLAILRDSDAVTPVTSAPDIQVLGGAWSPDGTRLAFLAAVSDDPSPDARGRAFVVDSAGAEVVPVTDPGLNVRGIPTWSPDGTRLAMNTLEGELWTVGADGSDPLHLTSAEVTGYGPRWSPDGGWIAYVGVDGEGRQGLHRVRTDDSQGELLLEGTVRSPRYAPDGTRIVFEIDSDIGVIDADGTDEGRLSTDPGFEERGPRWSPDGSFVAFQGPLGVEIVDSRSGAILDVFRGVSAGADEGRGPAWSPDGRTLAFFTDPNHQEVATGDLGQATLWRARVDGRFVIWHPEG